jgi:hypothetical protein
MPALRETVRELLIRIWSLAEAVDVFFRKLRQQAARSPLAQTLLGTIPEEKRFRVLAAAGGALGIAFVMITLALLRSGNSSPARPASAAVPRRQAGIPSEELFLPDEPDFLPGVLLERERRGAWTAEDAAPWWQDPLIQGEEAWRDSVEAVIDAMLEQVP